MFINFNWLTRSTLQLIKLFISCNLRRDWFKCKPITDRPIGRWVKTNNKKKFTKIDIKRKYIKIYWYYQGKKEVLIIYSLNILGSNLFEYRIDKTRVYLNINLISISNQYLSQTYITWKSWLRFSTDLHFWQKLPNWVFERSVNAKKFI